MKRTREDLARMNAEQRNFTLTSNTGTLRVNQYLTNLSIATSQQFSVADFIAPPFTVKRRTGRYAIYSRSMTHRVYNDAIMKGEKPKQIETAFSYGLYSTEKYGLSDYVYDEDEEAIDFTSLRRETAMAVQSAHMLAREYRVISVATNPAFVTATSTAAALGSGVNWANKANGTPIDDILLAKERIWNNSQREANAVVMTIPMALRIIQTANWREQFKYTETGYREALLNAINGMRSLGLEPRIAGLCGLTSLQGTASDPDDFASIWGNVCLISHRVPAPTTKTDTFMYSPYWYKDRVRQARGEEEQKIDAAYVEIKSDIDELLINANAAYLITSCI